LIGVREMLSQLPAVTLDEEQAARVQHGSAVTVSEKQISIQADQQLDPLLIVDSAGNAMAIGRAAQLAERKLLYTVTPRKVLTKADERANC
jgi:hypothetical protein